MAQLPNPPAGYLNRKVAQSVEEAVQSQSVDHIKTIVKAAVQRYIESYMNSKGGNRELFETFSQLGLQYITDHSFDPHSDPTMRKVQLARLFEQLRQEMPAILIMDSAFNYVPMNFTGLDAVWIKNGQWFGRVQIVRDLVISVVAATRDQSTTDFLHGLLSVLFGEMKFLGGGTRMTGNANDGETWVMTMGNPKLGTVEKTAVSEDPKDKIYSFSIEIPDILYEDSVVVQQPIDRLGGGSGQVNPAIAPGLTPPTIICSATVAINSSARVMFQNFQPLKQRVILSDPNVATYDPISSTLYPRQRGTVEIQVIQKLVVDGPSPPEPFNQQDGNPPQVVASKTVTITSV